jgi:hypothetical protein
MSFGFGVGDFIAVGTLAAKAYACLQDGTGSAADYQALKLIRDSLGTTLEAIKRQTINSGSLSKSVENAINQNLQNCSGNLRDFDEKTKKFVGSLSPGGSGNKVTDAKRKLQWNNVKNGIRQIFRDFHENITAIGVLWGLSTGCVVAYLAIPAMLYVHTDSFSTARHSN